MKKCIKIKNKEMRRFSIFNLQTSICLLVFSMFSFSIMAQDVYVGGELNGKAAVWKNGVPTTLPSGSSGCIYSVIVDNGNVYATGFVREIPMGPSILKVWKDGVELYVLDTEDATQTDSYSVFVSGNGDVYTAGRIRLNGVYIGKVWKNGIIEPGYENSLGMNSVFVSGGDVYVAGTTTDTKATVWKNGEVHLTFDTDTYGYAKSVAVVDNIVYTACYRRIEDAFNICVPHVYKNDTLLYALESTGSSSAMLPLVLYVSENDVYVAGHERPGIGEFGKVPKLWKNDLAFDLPTTIPDPTFGAHSVYKFNDDVYVAGAPRGLWINGIITPFSGDDFCITYSVFVAPSDTPPTYDVILYSNPPEAGEVIGGGTFAYGDVVTVSGVPTPDYEFINWLEDGIEIFTGSEYTFTVTGTRTLTGNFETYDIVILSNTSYGIVSGGGNYRPGIEITASATVAKTGNYEFVNWTKEGVEVSTDAEYTFITPIGDMELVANFRETTLDIEEINSGVEVYPNPTDGQLIIDNGELTIDNVEIFDLLGKTVFQLSTLNSQLSTQIDISHLPTGVYFIQIQTENGMIVRKVVKN